MYQDAISAISTPIGQGGIVRLSGSDSFAIAQKPLSCRLSNRRLVYGHIIDPASDEVLVAYMAAPHTYTREDVVEINCCGGPLPLQHILKLVLRYGARIWLERGAGKRQPLFL